MSSEQQEQRHYHRPKTKYGEPRYSLGVREIRWVCECGKVLEWRRT